MEHKQEKTQAALCGVAVIVTVALILAIIGPGAHLFYRFGYQAYMWANAVIVGG